MIVPIKTLKVDTLTIHVYNSRQDMGIAAYELYKKHVRELMACLLYTSPSPRDS